ncbi:MAG: type II toxin-antitoxin system RelB/DinJ family antitoxin [Clostridiales bacterium]
MAQTTISIRMDADVKKRFDDFCSALGMNTSVAINLFVKAALREQRIPFELSLNVPNAETVAAILEGERMLNDPDSKKFSSVEELFEDLNS